MVTGAVLQFTWKPYRQAVYYDLQIWLVQAVRAPAVKAKSVTNLALRLKGTDYGVSVIMMPLGIYQWRMAAANALGALISSWSPMETFTIAKA